MLFSVGSQVDPWESREKTEEGGRKIWQILWDHLISRSFLALSFEALCISVPVPVTLPVICYNSPALNPNKFG